MDLLSILIKKRDSEWIKSVAECAENFTAKGALSSSGFQLALVDLLFQELEARCCLYLEHSANQLDFDEFFKTQKASLHSGLISRFRVSISGEERYNLLHEEYRVRMSSNRPPEPKPLIGFNMK